jgi:hypothetical protein
MPSFIDRSVASMHWRLIESEVEAWKRSGYSPLFWWRDDDARRPSAGLDRLLRLSAERQVPLALAVIPDVDLTDLATAIDGWPLITTIQHGCDHIDRNKGGRFSAEFAHDCPTRDIAAAVNEGWRRLSEATDVAPLYAPPWNVLTPNVRRALADTPLRGVSLYGALSEGSDGLLEINTHIDVMKWRPARFRGSAAILNRIWRQLRTRRRDRRWKEPVGLLTHHKNLDASAWLFLDAFLQRATGPDLGFRWLAVRNLMGEHATMP